MTFTAQQIIAACDNWRHLANTPDMLELVDSIRAKLLAAQGIAQALEHVLMDCSENKAFTVSEVTEKIVR